MKLLEKGKRTKRSSTSSHIKNVRKKRKHEYLSEHDLLELEAFSFDLGSSFVRKRKSRTTKLDGSVSPTRAFSTTTRKQGSPSKSINFQQYIQIQSRDSIRTRDHRKTRVEEKIKKVKHIEFHIDLHNRRRTSVGEG